MCLEVEQLLGGAVGWGKEGGEREGKLMLIAGVETLLDKAAFPWLGNGGEWLLLALYCVLAVQPRLLPVCWCVLQGHASHTTIDRLGLSSPFITTLLSPPVHHHHKKAVIETG